MYDSMAQYLIESGGDPRAALNKSHDLIGKAISLNPKSYSFYLAKGDTLVTKAEYENEFGLDLTESVNAAISAEQKAIELNPNSQGAYGTLAFAFMTKAEYLSVAGENPMEALDQAEKAYREVLRIRTPYPWAERGIAQALWRKAEFLVDSKQDPTSFVNDARFALTHGIANDPSDWACYAIHGELEIVSGRWKMLQQKSPESEFQHSQDLFVQAIKVGPKQPFFDVRYSQARLFRWWAEWKVRSNQSCEKEIRTGLDMVSKALELNPRSAEMVGTRGIFWFIQARSISADSQRKELLEKASSSFKEAIKLNSNFSHTFSPLLKEAENLATSN